MSKPEAGQWWFPNNVKPGRSANQRAMFVVGYATNGDIIGQSSRDGAVTSWSNMDGWHHEPRCTGWDWVVPEDPPSTHCRVICQASKADGVICPHDSCDIEDGLRATPSSTEAILGDPVGVVTMQKAEDPDEWVVQDLVPVRVGIDRITWYSSSVSDSIPAHPRGDSQGKRHGDVHPTNHLLTLRVWCRRRDLPKVEQTEQDAQAEPGTVTDEQWPKYYTTLDSPNGDVAFVKRVDATQYSLVFKNGTECDGLMWRTKDTAVRKQLTEAAAMALLEKPEPVCDECGGSGEVDSGGFTPWMSPINVPCGKCSKPQSAKKRVRLWVRNELSTRPSVFVFDHCPQDGEYLEIHYDADGFYVFAD